MVEAKKATAKKAAAKKTAAAPKVQEQAAPEAPVYTPGRDVYAFPLRDGDYFSIPTISRRSVSRGPAVMRMKKALGLPLSTGYDDEMADAIGEFQRDNDLPFTKVVDKVTWDAIFKQVEGV